MFGKRASELTPEDIDRVVSEQVQEGSQVEFKGTLPAKGSAVDPWVSGKGQVGEFARNKLVEEVIAFANAHGGWVLVGVEETREKPARASVVVPIRDCADLAERLRLMCRDCIEPTLPILEVAGVAIGTDRAGVVAFHVPRSRMAPHRHTVTKECYIRRADRTEKMTMREIQDLTLQVDRGLAAIGRRFSERQELFASTWEERTCEAPHAFGMRATLVPLTPLCIERVHDNDVVRPPTQALQAGEAGGTPVEIKLGSGWEGRWRPVLRGTVCAPRSDDQDRLRAVFCDGLIEYQFVQRYADVPSSHVLGVAGNSLLAAERFRRAAGAPDAEYGLELELIAKGPVRVMGYGGPGAVGALTNRREVFPT
jgi:hypothetical protein